MNSTSKEILQVTQDNKFALAIKRRASGDLVGALNILYGLIDSGYKSNAPYSLIAKIYYDMELYNFSAEFWFKFLSRTNFAKHKLEAYSALSACFCELGDAKAMSYYADKKFSLNAHEEQEYDHVILDYFDYVYDCVGEKYHIVYPDSAIKPQRLIFEGDALAEVHAFNESNELLQKIPIDKEEYLEAQLKIVSNLVSQDRLEEAKDQLETLYKYKGDNAIVVIHLAMFYFHFRDKFIVDNEVIGALLDECMQKNVETSEGAFQVALMLAEFNRLDDSLTLIEKSLSINEYEINAVFLKGLIYLNQKKFEQAVELFTWLYQIVRNPVVERYLTISREKIENSEPYSYDFRLPKADEDLWLVNLGTIITKGKKALKLFTKEEIKKYCGWGLCYHEELEGVIIGALFSFSTAYFRNYLLELLTSTLLSSKGKLLIIETLVLNGYNKSASVCFENTFIKLKFVKAEFEGEKGKLFLSSYAKAFAITSAFNSNAVEIRDSALKIYERLKSKDNLFIAEDECSLSCAIAINAGFKIRDKKLYEILFDTTKDKVDLILLLMGDDDENS